MVERQVVEERLAGNGLELRGEVDQLCSALDQLWVLVVLVQPVHQRSRARVRHVQASQLGTETFICFANRLTTPDLVLT